MASLQTPFLLGGCTAEAIPFPNIFGAEILSLKAEQVLDYTGYAPGVFNPNHPDLVARNVDFCNVTVTHTHPGQDDTLITNIWMPNRPAWNGRMQAIGGGGWVAGLFPWGYIGMNGAISEGYATLTTNGGLPTFWPDDWALLSPGNVNMYLLQDFASVSLNDAALIGKSVIESFYGEPPKYSYWSGCSAGGRQGIMLAQRYPTAFDGIAAAAPAVNWAELFVAAHYPQQVMNELGIYPHPCELDALTLAAIKACDGNDGIIDGVVSDPDSCIFDPFSLVGNDLECGFAGAPKTISKAAAIVADAAWTGPKSSNGSLLWYSAGFEANMTGPASLAGTVCSDDGTCGGHSLQLFTDWIRLYVKKDPWFDFTKMSRKDYEGVFRASVRDYSSIIGTNWPDLSEFDEAGGKMITYHGLVSLH
jgi:Tannase and feruloyl esterase